VSTTPYPNMPLNFKLQFLRNDCNATALILQSQPEKRDWDRVIDWLRDTADRVTLLEQDVHSDLAAAREELAAANATIEKCNKANDRWRLRHVDEWREEDGTVIWFENVAEWTDVENLSYSYVGSPLETHAPAEEMQWWIPFPDFSPAIAAAEAAREGKEGA
jgi:hypothetical protein